MPTTSQAQGPPWSASSFADEIGALGYDWLQPSLDFIARHIPPGSRVLRAGCGPGRMLHFLPAMGERTCAWALTQATC